MGATAQARRVGSISGVAHQATPRHRVSEGTVQAAVYVMHGHGGEAALTILAPRSGELGVEAVQGSAAQFLQLHRTDEGHDVAVDVLHVGVVGRGSHGRLGRRQPLLLEVLPDRQQFVAGRLLVGHGALCRRKTSGTGQGVLSAAVCKRGPLPSTMSASRRDRRMCQAKQWREAGQPGVGIGTAGVVPQGSIDSCR